MGTPDRWRWLLHASHTGTDFTAEHLRAALDLVVDEVPLAATTSITEVRGGTYRTSAAASSLALELDIAQYANGDGPCMAAARDRQVQMIEDTAVATTYGSFASAAASLGIRSSLSVPIMTTYSHAALNIYSRSRDAFSGQGRVTAQFLGRALSRCMVGQAAEHPMSDAESAQVSERRGLIRAAQELVADTAATPADAFAALARRSSAEQRSIYALAAELVTGHEVTT